MTLTYNIIIRLGLSLVKHIFLDFVLPGVYNDSKKILYGMVCIMPNESKFAVLIDADNISDRYIKLILDEISNDGIATYKRIYGDWTTSNMNSWKKVLLDNSFLPIQQYGYTTGKNATDAAMIIDAMDIFYSGQVDGFCLCSSDSDFTRLAARLREGGMIVVGMGEQKTPKSFISACNRFLYLDLIAAAEKKSKQKKTPDKPADKPARRSRAKTAAEAEPAAVLASALSLSVIKEAIRGILIENSDEDDWMNVGTMGNLLSKRHPDFDVSNFGFSKFTPFIQSLGTVEIRRVGNKENHTQQVFISLKPE